MCGRKTGYFFSRCDEKLRSAAEMDSFSVLDLRACTSSYSFIPALRRGTVTSPPTFALTVELISSVADSALPLGRDALLKLWINQRHC